MKGALRVGTVLGIPIYIHFTFLLILPIFALAFALQSRRILGLELGFADVDLAPLDTGLQSVVQILMGTVAAVVFFSCILLHELGHSYVAQRYNTRIRAIVLMVFGGVAQMEQIPREPRRELRVALAGPMVNFAIAAVGLGLLVLPIWDSSLASRLLGVFLDIVTFYNASLGLFNLIPAFPMDGGRVLRALLARRMNFVNATETAATVGKAFAFAFGVVGLVINPWLILIALFVYLGAGEEERLTRITLSLEGVRVGDIMTREVSTVSRDTTVLQLLDRMLAEKHMGYPVMDGRLDGIVTLGDATRVPADRRWQVKVGEIMSRILITIQPEAGALEALDLMSRHQIGRLLVLREGKLAGIITRSDVLKSVDLLQARRAE